MDRRKDSKLCDLLVGNFDSIMQNKIDFLPDELVVHILSFMKLREAVKTSVLSRRWRNLWMRIPGFTFDAVNIFGRELNYVEQQLKTRQFVKCVENVLSQLSVFMPPSHSIQSLTVYYELIVEEAPHIDRWISFGIEHNVEKLNFFFRKGGTIDCFFPPRLLDEKRLGCLSELRLGGIDIVPSFVGFKNLKLVSLISVAVTDEAFADLLSNCLFLVDLFVCSAKNLTSIIIPESLDQLRFLHIYLCPDLLKLEVSGANLGTFSYVGDRIELSFNNISKLMLLRLSRMDEIFCQLMKENVMLHTLALDLGLLYENFDMDYRILPPLTNLKVLILSVVGLHSGFAGVVKFLRAAPSLNRLELYLQGPDFRTPETGKSATESFFHKHLQEIELSGFSGGKGHIEIACSLIDSAVILKKMTIHPCLKRFYVKNGLHETPDPEWLDAIRKCKDQIFHRLPPTAKLEFIE